MSGSRVAAVGLISNIFLTIVKGLAGLLGSSNALIADAIESAVDVGNSLLVFGAIKLAKRPPDDNHPYGHGKAEPLAGAALATVILIAAALIARDSIFEILEPSQAPHPFTLYVLIGVIVIKEFLFRYAIKVGNNTGSTLVKVDAWHHRCDAFTSLAALIGISCSVVGGERFVAADDWAALFASFVIALNGLMLLRPAVLELSDATPDDDVGPRARSTAVAVPGVMGVEKLFVRKMGTEYFIDLHLEVDGGLSVMEGHALAHKVKDAIREENRSVREVLIHVEPFDG